MACSCCGEALVGAAEEAPELVEEVREGLPELVVASEMVKDFSPRKA